MAQGVPAPVTTQAKMVVASVGVSVVDQSQVVILRTEDPKRLLPIWIGGFEAQGTEVKPQDLSFSRPFTHDRLGPVIAKFEATVHRVVVTEISNGTFYGKVVLDANGETIKVDSRSSDVIAFALRVSARNSVEDSVLSVVGFDASIEPDVPLLGRDEMIN